MIFKISYLLAIYLIGINLEIEKLSYKHLF